MFREHVGQLPQGGQSLIVVATVGNTLHFRVFESDGKIFRHRRDETDLLARVGSLQIATKKRHSVGDTADLAEEYREFDMTVQLRPYTLRLVPRSIARRIVTVHNRVPLVSVGEDEEGTLVQTGSPKAAERL